MRPIFSSLFLALVFIAVSGAAHAGSCTDGFPKSFDQSKVAQWCALYAKVQGSPQECSAAHHSVANQITSESQRLMEACDSPAEIPNPQCRKSVGMARTQARVYNADLLDLCKKTDGIY